MSDEQKIKASIINADDARELLCKAGGEAETIKRCQDAFGVLKISLFDESSVSRLNELLIEYHKKYEIQPLIERIKKGDEMIFLLGTHHSLMNALAAKTPGFEPILSQQQVMEFKKLSPERYGLMQYRDGLN